jgi:hypothetical protein
METTNNKENISEPIFHSESEIESSEPDIYEQTINQTNNSQINKLNLFDEKKLRENYVKNTVPINISNDNIEKNIMNIIYVELENTPKRKVMIYSEKK